ncbi:hypothetical protein WAI01_20670, partial [Acinetobacter baumannii]
MVTGIVPTHAKVSVNPLKDSSPRFSGLSFIFDVPGDLACSDTSVSLVGTDDLSALPESCLTPEKRLM